MRPGREVGDQSFSWDHLNQAWVTDIDNKVVKRSKGTVSWREVVLVCNVGMYPTNGRKRHVAIIGGGTFSGRGEGHPSQGRIEGIFEAGKM